MTTPSAAPNGAANGTAAPAAPAEAAPSESVESRLERLEKENAALRKENGSARVKAKEAMTAAEQAQAARLAEQGKFEELYQQSIAKLKETEAKASQADVYRSELEKVVEAELASLPETARAHVPEGLDLSARLSFIRAAKALAGAAGAAAPKPRPSSAPPSLSNSAPGVPTDPEGLRRHLADLSPEDRRKTLAALAGRPTG